MVFQLRDALRFFNGGSAKEKAAFSTEKEAYDFCRNLYKKTGGATPELRRAYEFYVKNYNDDCAPSGRFEHHQDFETHGQR